VYCLLRSEWRCPCLVPNTNNQPANPTLCVQKRQIRGAEGLGNEHLSHSDPPRALLDPAASPRFSSDTHAPRRQTVERTWATSREATHWDSNPPGTRPTRSFRSQTSRWWMILPCSLNDRRVKTWSCRWNGLGRASPMPGTVSEGTDCGNSGPFTLEKDTCNERLGELRCASDVKACV
jgi:hypothetical protein